jgi:hypothetical protein
MPVCTPVSASFVCFFVRLFAYSIAKLYVSLHFVFIFPLRNIKYVFDFSNMSLDYNRMPCVCSISTHERTLTTHELVHVLTNLLTPILTPIVTHSLSHVLKHVLTPVRATGSRSWFEAWVGFHVSGRYRVRTCSTGSRTGGERSHVLTFFRMCAHSHTQSQWSSITFARTCTYIHTYSQIYKHARIHSLFYIFIPTHTHSHTHLYFPTYFNTSTHDNVSSHNLPFLSSTKIRWTRLLLDCPFSSQSAWTSTWK